MNNVERCLGLIYFLILTVLVTTSTAHSQQYRAENFHTYAMENSHKVRIFSPLLSVHLYDFQVLGKGVDASRVSELSYLTGFAAIGAEAALSGGYLQNFEPPLGLGYLRISGREIQPLHRSWLTSGFFCTTSDGWLFSSEQSVIEKMGNADCLQAGPFLVSRGKNRYEELQGLVGGERTLANTRQDQSFVCETHNRQLVLAFGEKVTPREASFYATDALGCRDALLLSGNITAGLWTAREGLHGNASARMTSFITVTRH